MKRRSCAALLAVTFAFVCASCGADRSYQETSPHLEAVPAAQPELPSYRFGVQPMRSTRRLWARYQPLLDEINAGVTGFRLRLESALSEQAYQDKVDAGALDVVIIEPHRVLAAEEKGYAVFARTGNKDRISGLIVVRGDSPIRNIGDLKGKTLCFSRPDALGSTMLVRRWLWEASFPIQRAGKIIYAGSQESALLQVYLRSADAAGVSRSAWEAFREQNPHMIADLQVKWRTDDLSGPAVMAHKRVPAGHVRQIENALLHLNDSKPGRQAMQQSGFFEFRHGEDVSYDDVWAFLNDYRRLFGPDSVPGAKK